MVIAEAVPTSTSRFNAAQPEGEVFESIGVMIPRLLLPHPGIDMTRWAVIACDQFTSQPEYWEELHANIGEAPSTINLVLPEVYLETREEEARTETIRQKMQEYLQKEILEPLPGMLYIERQVDGKTRKGLMLCLDLEKYDYSKGSQSLIRATEGTIIERLPPRMRIRQGAALELPHILVLIDDPDQTVIEPVGQMKDCPSLQKRYDFELMQNSGHLAGYQIVDPQVEQRVISALQALADPPAFTEKYNLPAGTPVLLFAMGDGNHSLATAKNIWEELKPTVGMNHPARYALVEIENVHDAGLAFEPIHRVLFGLQRDIIAEMQAHFGEGFRYHDCVDCDEMTEAVNSSCSERQVIGVSTSRGFGLIELTRPASNLAVGTIQPFIDQFMKSGGATRLDYVHGHDVVCGLGAQPGNIGLYLPCMHKNELFRTVILDGALPRKTFSMGEAHEKRFYVEARQIAPLEA